MIFDLDKLPRLLYVGDVPVESTVAGSALLYRLLQEYPIERLCIVQGNITTSQPQNRLLDVTYQTLSVGYERLLRSRFVFLYTSYLFLTAKWRSHQLTNLVKTFQPEAILTVVHGLSWITAAELAKKHNLPLHLIVHDEFVGSDNQTHNKGKCSVSITYVKNGAALGHTGINIDAGNKAPGFAYSTKLTDEQATVFMQKVIDVFHYMTENIFVATTKIIA